MRSREQKLVCCMYTFRKPEIYIIKKYKSHRTNVTTIYNKILSRINKRQARDEPQ